MSESDLESILSRNFAILCSSIEAGMKQVSSGGNMMIRLPPGWDQQAMEPKLRAWCEIMGYAVVGFRPDFGGSVVVSKGR